jgi:hypothetical protein
MDDPKPPLPPSPKPPIPPGPHQPLAPAPCFVVTTRRKSSPTSISRMSRDGAQRRAMRGGAVAKLPEVLSRRQTWRVQ